MAAVLFKVGALALKTLAKPLGDRFQRWVMSHPTARTPVIAMARRLHRAEVYITRGAEGKTGKAFVGDLTEDKALQLASKIASEGFVFTVGLVVVLAEYDRTRRKDIQKKAQEEREKKRILEEARKERERLVEENEQQQQLLLQMMSRVDKMEILIKELEEEKAKEAQQPQRGVLGGIFSLGR